MRVFCSTYLFLILNDIDIVSDANDITLYKECDNVDAAVKTLKKSTKKLFQWFTDNQMKGKTCKCYFNIKYRRLKSNSN